MTFGLSRGPGLKWEMSFNVDLDSQLYRSAQEYHFRTINQGEWRTFYYGKLTS